MSSHKKRFHSYKYQGSNLEAYQPNYKSLTQIYFVFLTQDEKNIL